MSPPTASADRHRFFASSQTDASPPCPSTLLHLPSPSSIILRPPYQDLARLHDRRHRWLHLRYYSQSTPPTDFSPMNCTCSADLRRLRRFTICAASGSEPPSFCDLHCLRCSPTASLRRTVMPPPPDLSQQRLLPEFVRRCYRLQHHRCRSVTLFLSSVIGISDLKCSSASLPSPTICTIPGAFL